MAIAGGLLVPVLAMLMGCMVLLLHIGVPLWPALAVLVVLCGVAVGVVRRVTAPADGKGRDGWFGRLLKALIMIGTGGSGPGQ
ncbi:MULTISPECIES: hypothetical protein [unclassified Plantactinospora]|uniref:hypothetical protein n=1 Tax=unclassified Plantactinospora TaxID=2631981 RepID=UPI000D164C7E|nr:MULTISPECIES: hypothetical protein [unclassified Plantactinospora]AVT30618.1 hypothetical protein C6361_15300 [Plantactinospora sp. BC1]AVT37568.1 hypothetical protein C6W10_15055 [Plantactinospora sp. BB1]